MSARKLVYEGSDPERLLLEVWNAHGAEARISEPERITKGGVFGFFAKAHYRVEVDPASAPRPRRMPADADRADVARPEPTEPPLERSSTAVALDALVEETEDVFDSEPARKRSFDEVLAGVASSLGEDPGLFAAHGLADPIPSTSSAVTPPSTRPMAEPPQPAEPAPASHTAASPGSASPAPVESMPTRSGPAASGPAASGPAVSVPASALPSETLASLLRREEPAESPVSVLRQAGFPQRLLGLLESRALSDFALEAAFALLPPAPPLPLVPGSLIAVVGSAEDGMALARVIGAEVGLAPEELAIATASGEVPAPATARGARRTGVAPMPSPDLLVHDVESATALAPGWRRDRVGVVSVVAEDSPSGRSWTRSILRAIRPSATIAVADARTKNEDLATFLGAIGGVDSLALVGAELTVTPAQILALEVPVARLGGAVATGARWAAIVRAAAERRAA